MTKDNEDPSTSAATRPETKRFTRAAYLNDAGGVDYSEVPGWVGMVPHVQARGLDFLRMLGQRYIERTWEDPADAPSKITIVKLRSPDGQDGME